MNPADWCAAIFDAQLVNCKRAPDGSIDLTQRYFAAKACSQQISCLGFEKTSEAGRADIDRSRNNYDCSKKSEQHERSLDRSNEKTHSLIVSDYNKIKL